MRVRGTAAQVSQAFSAPLEKVTRRSHTRFQARSGLRIPGELAGIDLRVFGLAAVPEHHIHAHVLGKTPEAGPDNRYTPVGPYWFTDLKQAYDYPAWSTKTDGSGIVNSKVHNNGIHPVSFANFVINSGSGLQTFSTTVTNVAAGVPTAMVPIARSQR